MTRKKREWKFRDYSLELGPSTLIVGILNVTPDSFSDGGSWAEPDAAAERAIELQSQGADIIDIGAESTKPGAERVSEAEELRRLIPVLKRLKGKLDIPVSVDTWKVAVAEAALEHGAHIINDVSGLTWEPELAKTVLHYDAGLILSHMRGTPQTWAKLPPMRDVMGEIATELGASLHRATKAGVATDRIVLDPGIGFGKRKEQNSEILARLGELLKLPVPILAGPSRKSFLAQESSVATEFATAAAVTAAILNGAQLVRVHDVAAMRAVVSIADAIVASVPERVEATVTRVARRDEGGELREVVFGEEPPRRPVVPPALTAAKKKRAEMKELPLLRRPEEPKPASESSSDTTRAQREWEQEQPRRDVRPERRPRQDRESEGRPAGDRPAFTRGRPAAGGRSGPAGGRPGNDRDRGDRPRRSDDRDRRPPRDRDGQGRSGDRPAFTRGRPAAGGRSGPAGGRPGNDRDRGDRPPRSDDRDRRPPRDRDDARGGGSRGRREDGGDERPRRTGGTGEAKRPFRPGGRGPAGGRSPGSGPGTGGRRGPGGGGPRTGDDRGPRGGGQGGNRGGAGPRSGGGRGSGGGPRRGPSTPPRKRP